MNNTIVIKRYNNRKLYDMSEKGYTTLRKIRALVAKGNKIQVYECRAGKDPVEYTKQLLTSMVLQGERDKLFHLSNDELSAKVFA